MKKIRIKNNFRENRKIEIINQRRQNFKNIYTQIKRNIKTSFSRTKQKNKLAQFNLFYLIYSILKK